MSESPTIWPKRLGLVLFVAGLLMTLTMSIILFWPDMEASLFDAGTTATADEALQGLRCPYVMTATETREIEAVFRNQSEQRLSFIVRARISHGFILFARQDSEVVRIEPQEQLTLKWPVTVEDAAYGRLIMARVFASRNATAPAQQSSCGILVLDLPGISGQQVVVLGIAMSLLLLGGGMGLWWRGQKRPLFGRNRVIAQRLIILAAVALGSLIAGLLNYWLVGLLLLIFMILLAGTLLEQASAH